MLRNKFVWTMIVVVSMSIAALFTSTASALCPASCEYPFSGRDFYKGYFTNLDLPINQPDNTTYGAFWSAAEAPWLVDTVPEYVNFIQTSLSDTSNGSVNNHTGASAYIVTAMLGYTGPDFGGSVLNGVNTARTRFTDWQNLVQDYDNAGLINWNDNIIECPGDVQANMDYIAHDSLYFSNTFFPACINTDSISFLSPIDGSRLFSIKKSCGNPLGDNRGLPPVVDPPFGTVNPPTPANPTSTPPAPEGYNTGNTATHSSCEFTTGTAHDPSNNAYAVPVRVTYSGGAAGVANGVSSTTNPYAYVIATPVSVRNSISPVTATVVGRAADGADFPIGSITFGPCLLPTPSCGPMNVSPTALDPGTPFTVTTSVRYGSLLQAQTAQAQPGFRYFITITGPSGYNFSGNVAPSGPDPATFTFTGAVARPPTGITGTFTVGWGIAGPFGAINCGAAIPGNPTPPTFPVTNKPYFKVTNGDISAGAGMSTGGLNCASGGVAPNPDASIVSWNRGTAGGYDGAGTEYGALALKHLLGFASGQGSVYAPSALSFGNKGAASQVDVAQELYGGQFGNTACTADYFANADPAAIINVDTTIGATAIPNCTVGVPLTDCRRTMYVDGDVYITGNITFSGAYGSIGEMPSFSLIVRGNIYISNNVTQLDGSYIAQPTNGAATNGVIYTCAPSGFGTNSLNVLTQNLQTNCTNPLTVNGAFSGRQVWLLRVAGTISSPTVAETFNYSPELWLSVPYGNGLTPGTTDEYDAITSLPPVL